MTRNAHAALNREGFSRRDFLKSSGALIVGFSIAGQPGTAQFGGPVTGSPPLNQLDSWVAIAADGSVTAYSGKEELGQGISVAQAQLVAEELVRAVPAGQADLLRHSVHARSGIHGGQPVAPHQFQPEQSRAGLRHGS